MTPKLLRKLLRYEPETGKLFWRARTPDMFTAGNHRAEHRCNNWNGRWAGTPALATDNGTGYRQGNIFGKKQFAHRVIWAMETGQWPVDQIDHGNHDRADNRFSNLQEASHAENQRNCAQRANNTSGATGVSWYEPSQKWYARIIAHGRKHHLGYFADKQDAIDARAKANIKYGFHKNHGINLPEEAK